MDKKEQAQREQFDALELEIRERFKITDPKWFINSTTYYQDYVKIKKMMVFLCVEHKKIPASKISLWCKSTPPNISYHKKDFKVFLEKRGTHKDSLSQRILDFYDGKIKEWEYIVDGAL